MAALTPLIVPALTAGAGVGMNLLQRSQEQDAAERAAAADMQNRQATANLRLEDLRAREAEEAAARQDRLRRTQAQTRAALAARGITSGAGSGAAILQGLAAETARDSAVAAQEADRQAQNIQLGLDAAAERNLLQLSERRRRAQLDSLRDGLSLTRRLGNF